MEDKMLKILNELTLNSQMSGEKRANLAQALKGWMKLDDLNFTYFLALYGKYKRPQKSEKPLAICEGQKLNGDYSYIYPTAIASDELMQALPYQNYADLCQKYDGNRSNQAVLWIKKMQAGTGSSMVRTRYLANHYGISESDVKIGAKGTDLFITLRNGKKVSLAETQILQSISDAAHKKYKRIVLHDIVSDETKLSIDSMWEKRSVVAADKSYRQIIEASPSLDYFGQTFQSHVPTIDQDGQISYKRKAPGGHALFGIDAMRAAYIDDLRPAVVEGEVLICSVGNGEDLSSSPDPVITNWMIEEQVPLVMVTTTKTDIDLKGGQISIGQRDGQIEITMMEMAQAEAAGQLALFEQLGLRQGDREAFFNTNMIIINYNVFSPLIKKLVGEVGEDAFIEIIAPDLILNKKSQVEPNGETRTYTQLEGAMGTVLLNLDRYWRATKGKGLIHFLNVDAENRTKFFSPIKTAFDYFMQFQSDRFALDESCYRLVNKNSGSLPNVTLRHKFYKSVQNVLEAFQACEIIDLKSLIVEGQADFSHVVLKGHVQINAAQDALKVLTESLNDGKPLTLENGTYHV